jgi:hypothetical protein
MLNTKYLMVDKQCQLFHMNQRDMKSKYHYTTMHKKCKYEEIERERKMNLWSITELIGGARSTNGALW